MMTDRELMQQALSALVTAELDGNCEYGVTDSLRARLAQPEPEPVAWGIANTRPTEKQPLMMVMLDKPEPSHLVIPLYTAPPQREWVGLTDEEIGIVIEASQITLKNYCSEDKQTEYARAIEAKLREKNG